MPTAEFLQVASVAKYVAALDDDLTPAERDARIQTLADFATFIDRDPDVMIAEIFDVSTQKYKKRGFYTDGAKAFAASFDLPPNAQLQKSNIIRAFFIANGRRLLTEVPGWMSAE